MGIVLRRGEGEGRWEHRWMWPPVHLPYWETWCQCRKLPYSRFQMSKSDICASATNMVYDPQHVEPNLYSAFRQLGNFLRISSSLLSPGTIAAWLAYDMNKWLLIACRFNSVKSEHLQNGMNGWTNLITGWSQGTQHAMEQKRKTNYFLLFIIIIYILLKR